MAKNNLSQRVLGGELPPHSDNKNVISQVRRYNGWLIDTGRRLYQPDLIAYRDHLLAMLAPASVKAHLSSIRRSYKTLFESVEHRTALIAYLEQQFPVSTPRKDVHKTPE